MQQAVMEEEAAYEPPTYTYDEVFPALPESVTSASPAVNQLGQWNNKMRIGSSVVTQVSFNISSKIRFYFKSLEQAGTVRLQLMKATVLAYILSFHRVLSTTVMSADMS